MKNAFNAGTGTAPAADILKAALRGDGVEMSRLVAAGADIEARNVAGHTPLMIAAARGNIDAAKVLLDAGADLNAVARNRSTALAMTAALPSPEMTELLLARGASPLRGDAAARKSLLRAAVARGEEELFRMLVAAGEDCRYADEGKRDLLMLACESNQPGMVKLLIAAGLDPKAEDSAGKSAAYRAAGAGYADCLEPLLDALKAAVDKKGDRKLERLLCLAAEKGSEKTVALLLDAGARPNWETDSNTAPLRLAIRSGSVPCVELLLKHGADPMNEAWSGDKKVTDEDCAKEQGGEIEKLVCAAARKFHLPIAAEKGDAKLLRELLEEGVPVDIIDRKGATPLLLAAKARQVETAKILLEYKANPNLATKANGCLPLFAAMGTLGFDAPAPSAEVVDALLSGGADPNARHHNSGATALETAVTGKAREIAAVLLKHKADPNLGWGSTGQGPLFAAIHTGVPELVRLLIENGASTMRRDKEGVTPYDVGKSSPNAEIRDIMRDAFVAELDGLAASATRSEVPVGVLKTLKIKSGSAPKT